MTWLLHTPLTKTLPVGLADAYASLRLEVGSAYTLIFFLMIMPLLLALQFFGRPPQVAQTASRDESMMSRRAMNRSALAIDLEQLRQDLRRRHARAGAAGTARSRPARRWSCSARRAAARPRTLRIIAGLEEPDAGGRVLLRRRGRHRDCRSSGATSAWCSSRYALFPNMSVAENIGYGLQDRAASAAPCATSASREMLDDDAHRQHWPTAASTSCPAASASASRWPARWRCARACCCSTSR